MAGDEGVGDGGWCRGLKREREREKEKRRA